MGEDRCQGQSELGLFTDAWRLVSTGWGQPQRRGGAGLRRGGLPRILREAEERSSGTH